MTRMPNPLELVLSLPFLLLAACGGGGGGAPVGPVAPTCEKGQSFASTFDGIQQTIFEKHSCTQELCHGSATQGGLDLRAGASYDHLVEAPSRLSPLARVWPGAKDRSFLWQKLLAKSDPSVEIAGSPMPSGSPALSADELELVRLWIYAGAPREGTVIGTEKLLGACLPDPEPLTIAPLPAPPAGKGIQLVMPEWSLPASSEHEVCFASYFDVSDQVPAEFLDPTGQFFRFSSLELRQDPQSHHLILSYSPMDPARLDDPSFGAWTCKGGSRAGETCDPRAKVACGDGLCASTPRDGFACIGYGPPGEFFNRYQIGGAQQAQAESTFHPGVFGQIPLRGVLYWNSHAFNLTPSDHLMQARQNYTFATEQRSAVNQIFDASHIFAASAPPFETETVCADFEMPQGSRLFNLSSHTHRHGQHFTVDLPDGRRIYESRIYNDPVDQKYDPPLEFDSPDPAQRRLRYCSFFNNGVAADGSPDVELVTRSSRVPVSAQQTLGRCRPTACVAGRVAAACNGSDDDATCDSSPGAGDGDCDACALTAGESTENEMFILLGQFFMADPAGGATRAASEGGGAAARPGGAG
ncbi:MAG: hypothetical protein ACKO2K_02350 [Alphaproteobacteria bacterium]